MQITVLHSKEIELLSIECTQAGKQALQTDAMTPRERQFILLIAKNSQLSEKAIAHLLQKIDLSALVDKGWINYHISTATPLKEGLEKYSQALSVQPMPNQNPKDSEDKAKGKNLRNFLKTYAKEQQLNLTDSQKASVKEFSKSITHITTPPNIHYEPLNDLFEDIVIVQGLLED